MQIQLNSILLYICIFRATSSDANEAYTIGVDVYIQKITNINYVTMTGKVSLEALLASWESNRTSSKLVLEDQLPVPFDRLQFDVGDMWIIGPVEIGQDSKGTVLAARIRIDAELSCESYSTFPFDGLFCNFKIYNKEETREKCILKWRGDQQTILPRSTLDLYPASMKQMSCEHSVEVPSPQSTVILRRHSCVSLRLELKRSLWECSMRFFVPTILAAAFAWSALFVPRAQTAARLILLGFSVVFELLICGWYMSIGHPASVLTAADCWCLLLIVHIAVIVIVTLVTTSLEHRAHKYRSLCGDKSEVREDSRGRYERMAAREMSVRRDVMEESTHSTFHSAVGSVFRRKADTASLRAVRWQVVARIAVPVLFLISSVLFFLLHLFPYQGYIPNIYIREKLL